MSREEKWAMREGNMDRLPKIQVGFATFTSLWQVNLIKLSKRALTLRCADLMLTEKAKYTTSSFICRTAYSNFLQEIDRSLCIYRTDSQSQSQVRQLYPCDTTINQSFILQTTENLYRKNTRSFDPCCNSDATRSTKKKQPLNTIISSFVDTIETEQDLWHGSHHQIVAGAAFLSV